MAALTPFTSYVLCCVYPRVVHVCILSNKHRRPVSVNWPANVFFSSVMTTCLYLCVCVCVKTTIQTFSQAVVSHCVVTSFFKITFAVGTLY